MAEKRELRCNTCGRHIRARARNQSLGAAMRKHYWDHHPELMVRKVVGGSGRR